MRPVSPARERIRQAAVEVVLVVAAFVAFKFLQPVVAGDVDVATSNAEALQSLERALYLDVELGANRWLVDHPVLITPAVLVYRLYYGVLLGVLVWIFVRHADLYRHVRRALLTLCGLALVVYWVMPMSPPRFALGGAVDVVAQHDILGDHAVRTATSYQAMPSMHVALSAWAAYAAWRALRGRHPRWALAVWAYPLLMVAIVFGTANHYVLDILGSAVVLVLAVEATGLWDRRSARRRPRPAASARTPDGG